MLKKENTQKNSQIIAAVLLLFLVMLPLVVHAQDLTRTFSSTEQLIRGSVVSLTEEDNEKVEPAKLENIERLYGVVIDSEESPLILSDEDSTQVLVATSGRYEVLVSNLNGEIHNGDYLTASPIEGVAMLADDRQPRVVGLALQSFDTSNPANILSNMQVKTSDGKVQNVAIGRVLVDLDIKNNPLAYGISAPEVLIELGETIAGGPVSVNRIWGALVISVLTFLTGSLVFYAGARTSIIAIGRNPLSKGSVLRGFLQITFVAVAIFLTGGFAVYLVLKI